MKMTQMQIIEKMSKLTSELSSTTRELHKKNIELEVAKKELEKKDEMIIAQSRFVAMNELLLMLSHQWRQPLNIISLNAQNITFGLKDNYCKVEDIKNSVENIVKTTKDLSKTIDIFSSSVAQEESVTTSVNNVLDTAYELISPVLQANNIDLIREMKSSVQIKLIPSMLIQVYSIVVQNTLDAFEKNNIKKKIFNVKSYDKDGYINIECLDNAGGINEDNFSKIFEPYFSTKREQNGLGLGLYIAKLLMIKIFNGSINVENKNDGVKVTIKIPYQKDER